MGEDSLTVDLVDPRSSEPPTWAIAYDNLERVKIPGGERRSIVNGLARGAALRFVAGSVVAIMVNAPVDVVGSGTFRDPAYEQSIGEDAMIGGVLGAVAGGVVGASIGFTRRNVVWVEVALPGAETPVPAPPQLRLAISLAF